MEAKNYPQAQAAFEQAQVMNKYNPDAYTQYAVMLREQGKFTEAEAQYLKALAVWPHNLQAHRDLGVLYDLYLIQADKALQHFTLADQLSAEPNKELKGWILELNRRLGKNLQKLTQLKPSLRILSQQHPRWRHEKYLLLLLLSASVQAAEKPSPPEPQAKADDISISIHGNQEQPTVMHIVPWQEAGDNKIIQEVNKPPLNDLFPQIERSEHQREVRYLLNSSQAEKVNAKVCTYFIYCSEV